MSYPDVTIFRAGNYNGHFIHLYNNQANIGHPCTASVFILSKDLEGWKIFSDFTVFSNDVCASAHEVKAFPIKCLIMGITQSPTGANSCLGLGHT